MKRTKQQKGITLIALIITIIVLLILAVVTIREVRGDGIIAKAKEAKEEYEKAKKDEALKLSKYEYELAKSQNPEIGSYDEYILQEEYGLKVGDYVAYSYDTVSDGYALSRDYSGISYLQTIKQATTAIQWRVLGIDDNGNVELVSANPVDAIIKETGNKFFFKSSPAYNNGVYLLNEMCSELYSNDSLNIKARNLTLDDIEKQYSSSGKAAKAAYRNNSNLAVGETKAYASPSNIQPLLYPQLSGRGISDSYYTSKSEMTVTEYITTDSGVKNPSNTHTTANGDLTVTQTYYNFASVPSTDFEDATFYEMIYGTGESYWLASRYEHCGGESASFGLFAVKSNALNGNMLFKSSGEHATAGYKIRPVITIPSNLKIVANNNANSPANMWSIVNEGSGELATGSIAYITEEGVPIPTGFKYVEGTKNEGLVIQSETNNRQWVWVPIYEEKAGWLADKEVSKYGGFYVSSFVSGCGYDYDPNEALRF